jgi:ABC-type nickel/cobalt efflux system permease component RcnA
MESLVETVGLLALSAATIALLHTLAGPDHYLPFIALGKARGWSMGRQLRITLVCGVGHVAASLALSLIVIWIGRGTELALWAEERRGEAAGWLLLGFGIAYTAWGVRQALRDRPHSHWHTHADGTVHDHQHGHTGQHAHPHTEVDGSPSARQLTPWLLFVLLVLGPCEPLIPLLLYAAAEGGGAAIAAVAGTFAAVTLAAMCGAVLVGALGLASLAPNQLGRYAHLLAGLTLVACGLAVRFGL